MPTQRERNAIRSPPPPPSSLTSDEDTLPLTTISIQENNIKQRYAIKLSYDGTTYVGFQSQPHCNTIQDQIEHRLFGLLRRSVRIVGWGRTDSGVHAKGAVITVDLTMEEVYKFANNKKERRFANEKKNEGATTSTTHEASAAVQSTASILHSALKEFACNAPHSSTKAPTTQTRYGSISAICIKPVPMNFDARYSALWKRYVYYICATTGSISTNDQQQELLLPFVWNRYAWVIKQSALNLEHMINAAKLLSSTEHNFEWMCIMQKGEMRDTYRSIDLSVEEIQTTTYNNNHTAAADNNNVPYFLQQPNEMKVYKVTVKSDFFLYKMIRRIVGILVAIGSEEVDLDTLQVCLDDHDKKKRRCNNNNDKEATTAAAAAKIHIPTKLLQTAPAKGLCLEHIEYDIPI